MWLVLFPTTNKLITLSEKHLISFRKMHHDYGESTKPKDIALPIGANKCKDLAFLPGVHVPVPFPLLWPSLKLNSSLCSMSCRQELGKLLQESFHRRKERTHVMIHYIKVLCKCFPHIMVEINMGLGIQIPALLHVCCVTLRGSLTSLSCSLVSRKPTSMIFKKIR